MRCSPTLRSLVVAVAVAVPALAHAFAEPAQFFDIKVNPHAATYGPSGEGVYFTGAPRFASQTCLSCHVGGPATLGLRLGADDPGLFDEGYSPGTTYTLEVELTNESEGTKYNTPTCTDPPTKGDKFSFVPCNNNGFALEIDAAGVPLAGPNVFCAAPPLAGMCPAPDPTNDESLVAPDGDAVFANRARSADPNMPKTIVRNDPKKWHLWWTAPKAGTGPVTIYLSAVDGNGGAGTVANDQDPYGDDTVAATFFIQEANAPVKNQAAAGCSLAPSGRAPAPAWWALLFGLVAWRAVRRRAARRATRSSAA